MDQPGPVEKFWNQPELIEMLVSFLNARSTLCLLQSRVMNKETMQKSMSAKAWNQLIRCTPRDVYSELLEEGVKDLVKILKLLELEEPITFMLPLLDLICQKTGHSGRISPLLAHAPRSLTLSARMISYFWSMLRVHSGRQSKASSQCLNSV